MKKHQYDLSRRAMMQLSAKGLASGGLLAKGAGLTGASLFMSEKTALGQAACAAGAGSPLIQITLIDKIQHALVIEVPGTAGAGDLNGLDGTGQSYQGVSLEGKALPAAVQDWRGMRLTTLFAEWLANFNQNSNMAIISRVTSQAGGHSLMNTDLTPEIGGLNYAKLADTSNLGYVGFDIRADANDSIESAVAPGRVPMPAYESVAQIRQTLKNSIAALNTPEEYISLRERLDRLAIQNDSKVLAALRQIKECVDPVLPGLLEAMTAGDIVQQQVQAVATLANSGMSNNFMIAIPWDDTNGGGNLSNPGGQFGLSPYVGTAMLGWAIAELSRLVPNAIIYTSSDGGRSRNNGDAAGGMQIVVGPADKVRQGVFGAYPDLAEIGNNGQMSNNNPDPYALSNGNATGILNQQQFNATIAQLAIEDQSTRETVANAIPYSTSFGTGV